MMLFGFEANYKASSSRCSNASPAGHSLSYYHSPADSFSSMGSPVNGHVRLASYCSRTWGSGSPGRRHCARHSRRQVRYPFWRGGRLPQLAQPYLGSPGTYWERKHACHSKNWLILSCPGRRSLTGL